METNGREVIVFSRDAVMGLDLVRSLGSAGYAVDVISSANKNERSAVIEHSKYARQVTEHVARWLDRDACQALVKRLQACAKAQHAKPVLLPADLYTTGVLAQYYAELAPYCLMPCVTAEDGAAGSLFACLDRSLQMRLAQEAGLRTPPIWTIALDDCILPEDLTYPCVCEPMNSAESTGRESAMCSDFESLYRHLQSMQDNGLRRRALVRAFANAENAIDISGVCTEQEIYIPAVVRRRYMEGGLQTEPVGRVDAPDTLGALQEPVRRLLRSLHYVGPFSIELYTAGDQIYFRRFQPCLSQYNRAYCLSGANLPALAAQYLYTGTMETAPVDVCGKQFVHEKMAWRSFLNGKISRAARNRYITSADLTLLQDPADPAPYAAFLTEMREKARRYRKRKIRRRIGYVWLPLKRIITRYPQNRPENQRDPNAERPRVLVAGRNYCSNLCIARSLGMAGYDVEVLRVFQGRPRRRNLLKKFLRPDAYSKYIKAYHVVISARKGKKLLQKLREIADPDRKMLLVPADDLVAAVADAHYDMLRAFYVLPNIADREGEINRMMGKEVQKELARRAGLPVLGSCVIRTVNGQFRIPDTVHYPCFIKPNISVDGSKKIMQRCDSRDELQLVLAELAEKKDMEVFVEDYVEIGRECSLLGLSTKDGAIGPGFFVAEAGGQNEHRGVAVTGQIVSCAPYRALIEKLLAFVGSLQYDGLFDVDLIETTDGRLYFVELNLRYGGSGYAVTESGVNLPGMFADYMLLHKPIDWDCRIEEPGKRFVSEKVLIEEYTMGRISMAQLRQYMREVEIHFVKHAEDRHAYRHFRRYYVVAALMRHWYKLKNRSVDGFGS